VENENQRNIEVASLEVEGRQFVVMSYPTPADYLPRTLPPVRRDVVALALEGLSSAEIADRRGVSKRTIDNHLRAAFRQLRVKSKAELARVVIDAL